MSYSRKSCRTEFSSDQQDQIWFYLTSYRNYLTCIITGTDAPEPMGSNANLGLYPIPFSESVTLTYELSEDQKAVSFLVFDLLGNKILSRALPVRVGHHNVTIDRMEHLRPGIYLARFIYDGENSNRILIKH